MKIKYYFLFFIVLIGISCNSKHDLGNGNLIELYIINESIEREYIYNIYEITEYLQLIDSLFTMDSSYQLNKKIFKKGDSIINQIDEIHKQLLKNSNENIDEIIYKTPVSKNIIRLQKLENPENKMIVSNIMLGEEDRAKKILNNLEVYKRTVLSSLNLNEQTSKWIFWRLTPYDFKHFKKEITIPWQYARFEDTNISTAIIYLNLIKLNVSAVQRLILYNYLMELSE